MPLEIDVDGRGGAAVSSVTGSDLYPTGIAWLGDIPEHWDVRRLKYIVDFCGGGELTPEVGPVFMGHPSC